VSRHRRKTSGVSAAGGPTDACVVPIRIWAARFLRPIVFTCLLVAMAVQQAGAAGPLVDAGGFEAYTLGALEGQQGWTTDDPITPGSATVQSAVVRSGAKALQLNRAPFSDRRWAQVTTGAPSNRFVSIDWDMRVTATDAQDMVGPFFGVEAYDVEDPNPSHLVYGQFGSLGVDATSGEVLYLDPATGLKATTGEVTFGAWHHFRMLVDFTLDNYSVFFDGVKLATSPFYDALPGGLNHFTNSGLVAVGAAADSGSQGMAGTAYVDNYRVYNGIPGDFNFDGAVNGADLSLWKSALGSTSVGDADGDLDSDGRDFLAWQREAISNLLAVAPATAAIPEPTGALLAIAAALGLYALRRASA
jgi:hypothetical protein